MPSHQHLYVKAAAAAGLNLLAPPKRKAPQAFMDAFVLPLVEARELAGLTQRALEERIGAPERLVSKWECGSSMPSGFLLWCWIEALDCKFLIQPR